MGSLAMEEVPYRCGKAELVRPAGLDGGQNVAGREAQNTVCAQSRRCDNAPIRIPAKLKQHEDIQLAHKLHKNAENR